MVHSGSEAREKGIPETMACRILTLTWSFGPLLSVWHVFNVVGMQEGTTTHEAGTTVYAFGNFGCLAVGDREPNCCLPAFARRSFES